MSFFEFPHTRTYDSDLGWIIKEFKEIIANIEKLNKDVYDLENELIKINADIKALDEKIDDEIAKLDSKYSTILLVLKSELSHLSIQVNSIISDLQGMINNEHDSMVRYIDARIAAFINSLPDYNNLIIYNPVRGTLTNVQTALNDLYDYFNVNGLTATQYDSLQLTADEYDNLLLTAADYDSMGYILLGYPDPRYYMLDPFSGVQTLISKVVYKLFRLHYPGMEAQAYDALQLTASGYDALLLSAFDYDTFGIV